ncbi:MAG TPA: hypothetical protein VE617_02730 [Propionibacteriaceae bacterium]|nr:hypothetical protein [Propionibacteriaceae bacterium]
MSAASVQAVVAERFGDGDTDAPSGNEFVIFSKPELGRLDEEHLAGVWDLFAGAFAEYGVRIHRVKIMTGPDLERAGAMQQHYGVINQISREGRPALTEAAEQALQQGYGDALAESEVIGGHQFLDRYPEVSEYALAMLFANADVQRLGPGTYAASFRMDADRVIVLNGFHPRQLGFFIAADATCAFLHGSSTTDWEVLRSELIGATDPAKAAPGSIRGRLKADPAAYGLTTVNSNFNGVHMSAGPLEGLGELDRFFGEVQDLSAWTFAEQLRDAGLSDADLPELLANPVLTADGERGTAFDLTEGMNAEPAAALLVKAQRDA